jgi:hypothetical protein
VTATERTGNSTLKSAQANCAELGCR